MSRRTAIGAFATVMIGSVLLPLSSTPAHSTPLAASAPDTVQTGLEDATAGPTKVTASMKSEIDDVLRRGDVAARQAPGAKLSTAALAKKTIRCADLEGQRYCLHNGWTEKSEAEVVRGVTASAAQVSARGAQRESTGDLSPVDALRQFNALPPAAQRKAERAELLQAARSVGKVWLLRHQIQGEPLPSNFLARHPEVNTNGVVARGATNAANATKKPHQYPKSKLIMNNKHVAEQTQTYWCGPTSMQMIAWGWHKKSQPQSLWAKRLKTTTSGTAITEMVRVTNFRTGYGNAQHAGRYVALDISNYTFAQWWLLQMRHYEDYRAPIILHPILLKQFYPYLDDDASGHFQVGRGYDKNGAKPQMIHYFEPWNQQRFDPSEPFISRTQRRMAYRSYRANQAHFQHNIGV